MRATPAAHSVSQQENPSPSGRRCLRTRRRMRGYCAAIGASRPRTRSAQRPNPSPPRKQGSTTRRRRTESGSETTSIASTIAATVRSSVPRVAVMTTGVVAGAIRAAAVLHSAIMPSAVGAVQIVAIVRPRSRPRLPTARRSMPRLPTAGTRTRTPSPSNNDRPDQNYGGEDEEGVHRRETPRSLATGSHLPGAGSSVSIHESAIRESNVRLCVIGGQALVHNSARLAPPRLVGMIGNMPTSISLSTQVAIDSSFFRSLQTDD